MNLHTRGDKLVKFSTSGGATCRSKMIIKSYFAHISETNKARDLKFGTKFRQAEGAILLNYGHHCHIQYDYQILVLSVSQKLIMKKS